MIATSRLYDSDDDLLALTGLVATATDPARANSWHIGDVLWAMFQHIEFDPFANIRLWEDEAGVLLGFAWYYPREREVATFQSPALRGDTEMLDSMLEWGRERVLSGGAEAGEEERVLRTQSLASDSLTGDYLTANGFTQEQRSYLHLRHDLDGPIPASTLPNGWTVRQVGGADEWPQRVETHREVWQPSRVTLPAYQQLRAKAQGHGYRPELDLVVVAPDGEFASYCICWLDERNAIGEFEPVGTRAAYRGKGAGKALLYEGLRRLKALDARTAVVYTNDDNPAAIALYESAGFRVEDRDYHWRKQL